MKEVSKYHGSNFIYKSGTTATLSKLTNGIAVFVIIMYHEEKGLTVINNL